MSFSLINVCIIISPRPVNVSETCVRELGGEDDTHHGFQLVLLTSGSPTSSLRSITSSISRSAHNIFDRLTGTGIRLMPAMVTIPSVNSCIGALKNFSEDSNDQYTLFAGQNYIMTSAAFELLDIEDALCIVQKFYKWFMSLNEKHFPKDILVAEPITTKHNKTTMTETTEHKLDVE